MSGESQLVDSGISSIASTSFSDVHCDYDSTQFVQTQEKSKRYFLLFYGVWLIFDIYFLKKNWLLYIKFYFRPQCDYHEPLDDVSLERFTKKTFASETMKKVNWVKNMFQEWRYHRNLSPDFSDIHCDLENVDTITVDSVKFALCHFITEVKKIDGSDYPPKTLYEIVICFQFFLETEGFSWHLITDELFSDVKFTLDNVMKQRTEEGLANNV